ncbi:MerR family transcriptional regulator [uncultured Adlercreutzia sp.]|uniref:MerR family transcriptional regulator n=1 Tax=uncultured Adlercreutzia sp. TaxID=875803 RepID=UPI0025E27F2C|nr:MerR family transcriptional regulator [uncultured Adlercreutzia sp.]
MPRTSEQRRYLTCGQMARANSITEKTLRFYQKKGLLEPELVDEETGFRYYDILQSTTLDLITQLRTIGLSLDEIKEIEGAGDIGILRDHLLGQMAHLAEQRQALDLSERLVKDLLADCDAYYETPIYDQIIMEQRGPRYRLEFPLPPMEELARHYEHLSGSDLWEWVVRHVKQTIIERDWPLSLFHDVGYVAPRDAMDDDDLWARCAFVEVDESYGECFHAAVPFPEGLHLVMYVNHGFGDEGETLDQDRFQRMLDYAEAKNLEVVADPYCESLCRFGRLFNQTSETISAYCVPVRKKLPLEQGGHQER